LASYDASDVRSWPFCDIGRERLDVGSQIKSGHPTAIAMLLTVACPCSKLHTACKSVSPVNIVAAVKRGGQHFRDVPPSMW
jgi:hypothetical protein